jgi:hypothetical protein
MRDARAGAHPRIMRAARMRMTPAHAREVIQ